MKLYFDCNATTPVGPDTWDVMKRFALNEYANPSSGYQFARPVSTALVQARKQVAQLIGASQAHEIIFTSGGTESNNTALRSAIAATGKKEIITSTVEHSSVLRLCAQLEKEGILIHRVPVNEEGIPDLTVLRSLVSSKVAAASFMMANNETGVIFPIEEIAAILGPHGILFHVDAVQAAGKMPIHVSQSEIHFLSISGHKFYGPKGSGALYARSGTAFSSLIYGGSQERGRRAGTENVAGIVGLGHACEQSFVSLEKNAARLKEMRDFFESKITSLVEGIQVNGAGADRLCNTSNISFEGVPSEALMMRLDQSGICVSNGSACMSGASEPSHVLKAMGLSSERAKSAVRFSFGKYHQPEDIDFLIKSVVSAVQEIRQLNKKSPVTV